MCKSYCKYLQLIKIFICSLVAGTNEVVVGDLVYCKENGTVKETVDFDSEFLDDNSNEIYDNAKHLDETSEQDLPEKKNTSVKVSTYILDFFMNA